MSILESIEKQNERALKKKSAKRKRSQAKGNRKIGGRNNEIKCDVSQIQKYNYKHY